MAATVYILPSSDPFFSTFCSTLVISCLFDDNPSKGCEVISHRGFDLHFLLRADLGIRRLSPVQSHSSVLGSE